MIGGKQWAKAPHFGSSHDFIERRFLSRDRPIAPEPGYDRFQPSSGAPPIFNGVDR